MTVAMPRSGRVLAAKFVTYTAIGAICGVALAIIDVVATTVDIS